VLTGTYDLSQHIGYEDASVTEVRPFEFQNDRGVIFRQNDGLRRAHTLEDGVYVPSEQLQQQDLDALASQQDSGSLQLRFQYETDRDKKEASWEGRIKAIYDTWQAKPTVTDSKPNN